MRRYFNTLPAHALNGITVAVGLGCVQALLLGLAGHLPAELASAGALCASLADQAGTVRRNSQKVLGAALLATAASLFVGGLRGWAPATGLGIAVVGFLSMMTMAWGLRAAGMAFAPILAVVFAMATPHSVPVLQVAGWGGVGAAAYLGWSVATGWLLQRRLRTLALAAALEATARLMRSRASVLEAGGPAPGDGRLRTWVGDEAVLAEQLQAARNLLFGAPDVPRNRRATAILLRLVDLRDVLLSSRLDIDLLGDDASAHAVRERVAQALREVAHALDVAEVAVRTDNTAQVVPMPDPAAAVQGLAPVLGEHRARLVSLLAARMHTLATDVTRIQDLLQGHDESLPLTRHELQLFVAPEAWPLAAVRAQLQWRSPTLRHALRTALALGSAYFIAKLLPWSSHSHWLVLSVAVVLRGNLEQTLARRNARVGGTFLGCLLVVGIARLPLVQPAAFLAAVGVAHTYVSVRYLVTASAATVMALLQAHAVNPAGGFPITERLADTLLGAALAWAFSYVLPSWERRGVPQLVDRTLEALRTYAHRALLSDADGAVAQRLARLQAYDALGTVAAAVQRGAAEPGRVRVPLDELVLLLDHAHRLMAQLSVIRSMRVRRAAALGLAQSGDALRAADATLQRLLTPPLAGQAAEAPPPPMGLAGLPALPIDLDPLSWLVLRLQAAAHDAGRVATAARTLGEHLHAAPDAGA